MGFAFRIVFELRSGRLDSQEEMLELMSTPEERIWIQASGPLNAAERLTLRGKAYISEEAARDRGRQVAAALALALVRLGAPADFVERRALGGLSDFGIEEAQRAVDAVQPGVRVIRERAGIHVHPEDEEQVAFRFSATGSTTTPSARIVEGFSIALKEARASTAATLAFDLWSVSGRMPSADSRLLTLVSAIEALIERDPIDAAEMAVVDQLVETIAVSDLSSGARDSLSARVRDLGNESVASAGRRLVGRLNPEQYGGLRPERFFTACYELRSRLTHGSTPPSLHDVGNATAELERMVRDLIALELISDAEDSR